MGQHEDLYAAIKWFIVFMRRERRIVDKRGRGALLLEVKKAAYAAIGARNISFAQYVNFKLRASNMSVAAALKADLYGLSYATTGYELVPAVNELKDAAKRPVRSSFFVVLQHKYPDLPLRKFAHYYTIGSDLEFYSETFGAKFFGYPRMSFLSYSSSLCSTEHVEYAIPSSAWPKLGRRVDLIIDADPSQPIYARVENFEILKERIAGGGQ